MPSSRSAIFSQRWRQNSEIPKSRAMWEIDASPLRATAMTSRRDAAGDGLGTMLILPARPQHYRQGVESIGGSPLCLTSLILCKRSTNSVTATIPENGFNDGPARRSGALRRNWRISRALPTRRYPSSSKIVSSHSLGVGDLLRAVVVRTLG